jgi:hypothetical protein
VRIPRPPLAVWLILGAILIALGLLLIPAMQTVAWVGHTNLEVEFVVTDADTGQPIKGATIHVQAEEGGFCEEREKQQFSLVTNEEGTAKRLCKHCMCFGTSGWNIDTFAVHLPWWFYRVTAESYAPTELTELDVPENVHQVQRTKPAAKLVVPISLVKKAAKGHAGVPGAEVFGSPS